MNSTTMVHMGPLMTERVAGAGNCGRIPIGAGSLLWELASPGGFLLSSWEGRGNVGRPGQCLCIKRYLPYAAPVHEYTLFPKQTPSRRAQNHHSSRAKASQSRGLTSDQASTLGISRSRGDGQVRTREGSASSGQEH